MKKAFGKISIFMLIALLLLVGCANTAKDVGEPEPSSPDPAAGTSPKLDEDAAKAMQLEKNIDGIVSITLKNLEGNNVDRTFSADETASIQQAFNESYIMDTAYIEMIAGNIMTIALKDGREVFISSYGDENYIVARIGDASYHLGCPVIGRILLEETK